MKGYDTTWSQVEIGSSSGYDDVAISKEINAAILILIKIPKNCHGRFTTNDPTFHKHFNSKRSVTEFCTHLFKDLSSMLDLTGTPERGARGQAPLLPFSKRGKGGG